MDFVISALPEDLKMPQRSLLGVTLVDSATGDPYTVGSGGTGGDAFLANDQTFTGINTFGKNVICTAPPQLNTLSKQNFTTLDIVEQYTSGVLTTDASITLTAAQHQNRNIGTFATAPITLTLPVCATMVPGSYIRFRNDNDAGVTLTISTQGTDGIVVNSITTPVTSFTIAVGSTLLLIASGAANYFVF